MKSYMIVLILILFTVVSCVAKDPDGSEAAENAPATGSQDETGAGSGYEAGTWIVNYPQALQYAEALGRPVLINFTGSDWCIWCKKLSSEVFTQDAFLAYARENLVLLKIDFPQKIKLDPAEQKANEELAGQFGIEGFPTIVLVDAKGEEIARTGYQQGGAEKYVQHLQELLAQD
jgi:protein disulfide-isomerase